MQQTPVGKTGMMKDEQQDQQPRQVMIIGGARNMALDVTAAQNDSRRFKAMICKYWMAGSCKRGDECSYAHGQHELRRPPTIAASTQVETTTAPDVTATQNDFGSFKTRICKYWMAGSCYRGEECSYAHGEHELRRLPTITAPDVTAAQNDFGRFKTRICKNWMAGRCTRGDECSYAHGQHELRRPPTITALDVTTPQNDFGRFKRSICKYWMAGRCTRGNDCAYAHGQHELLGSATHVPRINSAIKRPYTAPFGSSSFGPPPPKMSYTPVAYYPQMVSSNLSVTPQQPQTMVVMRGPYQVTRGNDYAHGQHELLGSATHVPRINSAIKPPYTDPFGSSSFSQPPPKMSYTPAAYYPRMVSSNLSVTPQQPQTMVVMRGPYQVTPQ